MLMPELESFLSKKLDKSAGSEATALAEALTIIAQPEVFRSLLSELSSNSSLVESVANRSVWHPNGFSKIVLISDPCFQLRLHVWQSIDGVPSEPRENIHNHRWDFAMILLAGSYWHQEFRPADNGEEFHAYTYQSTPDGASYSLTPAGITPLRCVFDACLLQGSRYTIASEVIHRVIPDPRNPPVSLVLQGPPKPAEVDVFALEKISGTRTSSFKRLSASHLVDNMKATMKLPIFEVNP
jgi:hypothetical protein